MTHVLPHHCTSLSDLQMGTQLTMDYRELTLSRPVLQAVVDNLQLDFDYKDLRHMLTIDNPESTRILVLTIEDIDPEEIVALTHSDKKADNHGIRFILLKKVGKGIVDMTVTDEEMLAALKEIHFTEEDMKA